MAAMPRSLVDTLLYSWLVVIGCNWRVCRSVLDKDSVACINLGWHHQLACTVACCTGHCYLSSMHLLSLL